LTFTVSHIRPIVRRADDVVVAWRFRLTAAEGDASAFDDLAAPIAVPVPFNQWTQTAVQSFCNLFVQRAQEDRVTVDPEAKQRIQRLRELVAARLATVERTDLDIGTLPA